MQNLSFQDAFFLRAETPTCPFHVASLMIFSLPAEASGDYLRKLTSQMGRLPEVWPVFGRRLQNPFSMRNPKWVHADDYDPKDHVFHYKLPSNGDMSDLLDLASRTHEQLLDRTRPLWQAHIIEGLPGNKFGLYFKVHHSLVDGVGGLKMIQEMFTPDPKGKLLDNPSELKPHRPHSKESLGEAITHSLKALLKQSKAIPQAYSMLANIGIDSLLGKKNAPQLPFSAPYTRLNSELGTRRRFITCELPLKKIKAIGKAHGGTINDVLVAICGSALRQYLSSLGELPEKSLDAGIPVSMKGEGKSSGNQLSVIICPFCTDESDPLKRLRKITQVTKKAKADLSHLSPEATEDLATITMIPFLMITLTHSSQKLPPVFNTIVSNVPGPKKTLYLDGSKLEQFYAMSIVTDGMGLNITTISYKDKLCIGITSAPSNEPNIESLGTLIRKGYKELAETIH